MRLGLAGESIQTRAKALVLGPRSAARLIEEELESEGFTTIDPAELGISLPPPGSERALIALREYLMKFLQHVGQPPVSYAHCLHPGVSPWAERPEILQIGQELGLNVICPPARVLSLFANRLNLLGVAEQLGIAHLVSSFDPIQSVREAEQLLQGASQRFPFVLKSVRSTNAVGVHVVHSAEDLIRNLPLWLEQLRLCSNEAILFIERYVEGARRVVLPFARFRDGRTAILSSVDASLQYRGRKTIEFCPAEGIDRQASKSMHEWTLKLLEHVGYVGVGALEFLVDGPRAFLVEALPRLNTGFRLWESVEGTRAVSWQLATLDSAAGAPLPERKPDPSSTVGVGLRFFAEDSLLQLPQPGKVKEVSDRTEWKFPRAQAKLYLGIEPGSEVVESADGLLGLLIVTAHDRKQAITVARGTLDELWIAGSLQTNERFLNELLAHPWVRGGMFHAGFADEEFVPEIRPPAEVLQAFASVCASLSLDALPTVPSGSTVRWAIGDQWIKPVSSLPHWVGDPTRWFEAGWPGVSGMLSLEEGRQVRVCAYPISNERWQVRIGAWVSGVRRSVTLPRAKREAGSRLLSLVRGRVHSVLYRDQAQVQAHETLLVVESLGVLVPHSLPADVRIINWSVAAEDRVEVGQELGRFESASTASG